MDDTLSLNSVNNSDMDILEGSNNLTNGVQDIKQVKMNYVLGNGDEIEFSVKSNGGTGKYIDLESFTSSLKCSDGNLMLKWKSMKAIHTGIEHHSFLDSTDNDITEDDSDDVAPAQSMEKLTIKFCMASCRNLPFLVSQDTNLIVAKVKFAEKRGLPLDSLRFKYNGAALADEDTPGRLGMQDGDTVDVSAKHAPSVPLEMVGSSSAATVEGEGGESSTVSGENDDGVASS